MTAEGLSAERQSDAFLDGEDVDLGGIRWLAAGDRYCLLELGASMDLGLNLRAVQLANRLLDEKIDGLIETLPMFISVLIHFDSTTLAPAKLRSRVEAIWSEVSAEDDVVVPSRLIDVPVCYLDPWTRECVEIYSRTIKPIGDDPTFVAEISGLPGPEAFVRRHAFTQHWVGGVGFWPGLPDMMPLDPRCRHSIPKYDPPRLSTVTGAIGVGGGFTSIYPMDTPGGYHLIGRTPIPIFSFDTRLSAFRSRPTLFEPGDRVKFNAIDVAEFEEIQATADRGAYRFQITEGELFTLSGYRKWAADVAELETGEAVPW
ncbi:5-oxoprolinase subunit B family protein [Bauldia litoralis]|uniref:Sensor histidine kinase inhibitor, KipI family n=1 Tax=Bauldia litoralis TaxID=665467 RepID=A0A1G6E6X8_9HYPH|nr:carboxyltransferase domain-containing protein [Bauldia litoralis]SDB53070.1 sensor histidine kinase inhibitor, KipI family [Bauldia litoralis]